MKVNVTSQKSAPSLLNLRWPLFWLILMAVQACSPKPRAVKGQLVDGARLKKIEVTIENVEPADLDKPGNVYSITGCIDPTEGVFIRENRLLTLSHPNISVAAVCQIEIKSNAPDPQFTYQIKPGLLYQATGVGVSQTISGQLIATALMKKVYFRTPSEVPSPPTGDIEVETVPIEASRRCDFAKQIFNISTGLCENKP